MPNSRIDFSAELGVTNNRVGTLERAVSQLGSEQQAMGLRLSNEINQVASGLSGDLKAITSTLADRSKIPWPALAVMLTFISIIGGLVWYPVQANQQRLEAAILRITDVAVIKPEFEQRLSTTAQRRDDFQRASEARDADTLRKVETLQDRIVPRGEHEEKWRSADQRFMDVQRQVDMLNKSFGDTFSLRDALQQMQRRIDTLETMKRPS